MSTKRNGQERDAEADFDHAMERIDACLERVHKMAAKRDGSRPGTGGFKPSKIKRTRQHFKTMAARSVLTGSGDDLSGTLTDDERRQLDADGAA